jgi:hypothetical protein
MAAPGIAGDREKGERVFCRPAPVRAGWAIGNRGAGYRALPAAPGTESVLPDAAWR